MYIGASNPWAQLYVALFWGLRQHVPWKQSRHNVLRFKRKCCRTSQTGVYIRNHFKHTTLVINLNWVQQPICIFRFDPELRSRGQVDGWGQRGFFLLPLFSSHSFFDVHLVPPSFIIFCFFLFRLIHDGLPMTSKQFYRNKRPRSS